MKTIIVAALILLAGFSDCSRRSSSQSSLIGRYELQGQDNLGRRAFIGTISLTSLEQTVFKGRCTIVKEKGATGAPADQNPVCEASVEGKKVTIDLAPAMDDGGLILEGEFDGARITGVWMFKSFAGSQAQGSFEAVKKRS